MADKPPLSIIARRLAELQRSTAAKSKTRGKRKTTTPRDTRGLSLIQLLNNVWPNRKNNAKRDTVTITHFRIGNGGKTIYSKTLTYDHTFRPPQVRLHLHKVWKGDDEKPVTPFHKCKKILWTCDCEDHWYTWEYALTHHGASEIIHPGAEEFPVIKNSSLHPGVCKHAVVVLNYVLQHRL